jgi:hypothetical protein
MSNMPAAPAADADAFQPGQVGIRHLLGLMSVVSIVFAVSAARIRTLQPLQVALVAWHWTVLFLIVGIIFYFTSRRRRRHLAAAGELLLPVYSRPLTARRQAIIKWVLTTLVILDGIFISLGLDPTMNIRQPQSAWTRTHWIAFLCSHIIPQHAISEGLLWGWCLHHWITNVFLVEIRQNGLLTYAGYFAWKNMSGLHWSTAHPGRLVFFCRRRVMEIPIDPASRFSVDTAIRSLRTMHANLPDLSEEAGASQDSGIVDPQKP